LVLPAVLSAVLSAREAARRARCKDNLTRIGLALQRYHDAFGRYPPAAITDKQGRPILSWRVAILPYLGSAKLYSRFHLDEPWDSPHNLALVNDRPDAYACQGDPVPMPGMTGYQVVVGADTAFPPDFRPVRITDVTDGTSNTLAVGEMRRVVPWTKPEDVPEAGVVALLGLGTLREWAYHEGGSNALFLDGNVRFLKDTISPRLLGTLLTRQGGEVISSDSYGGPSDPAGLATYAPARPTRKAGRSGTAPTSTGPSTEDYDHLVDNPFIRVRDEPLSTFSVDVDTASYANIRRFLDHDALPPKDAVRIEEMLNYFPYDDPPPTGDAPIAAHVEAAACPWSPGHRLARIGLTARPVGREGRPPSNLVFLIDVSGSMTDANKLPLLKSALRAMVGRLGENDRVSIVVYAGASGLVLPSTSCQEKTRVLDAIERLESGGSTNGGAGIQLAYDQAVANFLEAGTNRVILATDGDFNVGIAARGDLIRLIETKARSGVFLTVLGVGMGNLKDATLEQLANKGNGHYAYIDSLREARKILIEELGATLVTVAKDVKVQVEFNPMKVGAYRLIGYENRLLLNQDFNDDSKDAGEIGAGHHVTALYELIPPGREGDVPAVDPLEFQGGRRPSSEGREESLVVKLRYKPPAGDESRLIKLGLVDAGAAAVSQASDDVQFAAAVAGFGMLLRDSPHKGGLTYDAVLELASSAAGSDPQGYRREFLALVRKAQMLSK
jgi:Ca-activated chloride channel family protein